MNARSLLFWTAALSVTPTLAHAAPASRQATTSGRANTGEAVARDGDASAKPPWINRWRPRRGMVELGVYGGVFVPAKEIELFEPVEGTATMGFREFQATAPDFGGRLAYFPLRFLGLEVEGGAMPSQTTTQQRALMYHARAHILLQLARWSAVPFIVGGVTGLGVASDRASVGNDIDLGVHFGGGVKLFLSRWTMLRLDIRDTLTARQGLGVGVVNSVELLAGFSITLGRPKPKAHPAKDSDGDGFLDRDDRCVHDPGVAPDGCPIPDTDGDGFRDPDDACPDEKGLPPDGCPIRDTDGDGFYDDVDQCVDTPGVAPDGCPVGDTDGDGIMDDVDVCILKPETFNSFEDNDGCPDGVPQEIDAFTGVIEGIFFDSSQATIKAKSQPMLARAVEVLGKYPHLRLEISGHTDSRGEREYNMDLSLRRAEAVKRALTDAGIEPSRLQTRGAGPDEPRDTNRTNAGRRNNRRIEFMRLD